MSRAVPTAGVCFVREQTTAGLEDVLRKIHEEGDISCKERVIGKELIKVGTRDNLDRSAGVGKVGNQRRMVDNLVGVQVNIPGHITIVGW